jgi:Zn-dependent protease
MLFGENSLLFIQQSLFNTPPGDIILWFVVFLFSLSFHESAHAWVSERFGDDTGRLQGRITLNPIAHIHPIGTIMIPLMGFMSGGIAMFGWAKPVETNPLMWRDKKKANIMVSAAGPISNFILATVALIILNILLMSHVVERPFVRDLGTGEIRQARVAEAAPFKVVLPAEEGTLMEPMAKLLSVLFVLNVILGVFNLIPIPPLDGSHVLESLLPYEMAEAFAQIRPYGFILLLALIWTPVLGWVIDPVYSFLDLLLIKG